MDVNIIYEENSLTGLCKLPDKSIHCCVTSPPYYGLRDYGHSEQIGFEETPRKYIEKLLVVFGEVKRVLRDDGTLWVNIGDSYAGGGNARGDSTIDNSKQFTNKGAIGQCSEFIKNIKPEKIGYKPKDLMGIPWMLAFALRDELGLYLRQDIIWAKPNPMPESVTDRCTKSHEYLFLFSKTNRYYFDYKAIMEEAAYDGRKDTRMKGSHKYSQNATGLNPQTFAGRGHDRWVMIDGKYMRNKRSVWMVNTQPFKEAHFAVFPEKLIVDCIKAGCPEGGIVLDPFMGSGTTAVVSRKTNRNYIGIELNPEYIAIAEKRLYSELGVFQSGI